MAMINYETILSSYDDKLTLMQWLKKVEDALNHAAAVSFNVNKRGDATITFSVVFEDGSEIESNPLTLQQGESVQSAYIQNGNLHLVLTNGDDLDAGSMFNGNVTINGNFEVTGRAKLPNIEGDENNNINVDGNIIIADGGISIADGAVSTPILTSENEEIEAEKPVVEIMTGYSVSLFPSTSNYEIENVYAGVAKNGNKITFVHAFNVKNLTSGYIDFNSIDFIVPAAIGAKLYTTSIKGIASLAFIPLDCPPVEAGAYINASCVINKPAPNRLRLNVFGSNFTQNIQYYVRVEATFLLSENLAA